MSVGLHYVATTGPGSSRPQDTDTNGIPDYVQNSSGDGSANPLDTDLTADLDGDGLDLQAEGALGLSPIVSDNPVQITTLSCGLVASGVQVSVAVAPGFSPMSATLHASGEIAPGTTELNPAGSNTFTFSLDTTRLDNGFVSISPEVLLQASGTGSVYNSRSQAHRAWFSCRTASRSARSSTAMNS